MNEPHPETEDSRAPESAAEVPEPAQGQVLLVRRRRAPTLGFWVVLAVVIGAVTGAAIAWIVDVRTLTGMLYFAATAVFAIGGPLALVAAVVDAIRHRRRPPSARP